MEVYFIVLVISVKLLQLPPKISGWELIDLEMWHHTVVIVVKCGTTSWRAFEVGASMGKLRSPVATPDSCLTATKSSSSPS